MTHVFDQNMWSMCVVSSNVALLKCLWNKGGIEVAYRNVRHDSSTNVAQMRGSNVAPLRLASKARMWLC